MGSRTAPFRCVRRSPPQRCASSTARRSASGSASATATAAPMRAAPSCSSIGRALRRLPRDGEPGAVPRRDRGGERPRPAHAREPPRDGAEAQRAVRARSCPPRLPRAAPHVERGARRTPAARHPPRVRPRSPPSPQRRDGPFSHAGRSRRRDPLRLGSLLRLPGGEGRQRAAPVRPREARRPEQARPGVGRDGQGHRPADAPVGGADRAAGARARRAGSGGSGEAGRCGARGAASPAQPRPGAPARRSG